MSEGSLEGAIGAENKRFMRAFAVGSSEGVAKLYTEDAEIMPPGAETLTGRDAIAGFWEQVMTSSGVARADLETRELEGHGDTAVEIGQYTLVNAEDQVMDQGSYLVVWRRDGDHWRLHRDIWNSDKSG